jgi:hypothetical protein
MALAYESIKGFAQMCHELQRSDRDCNVGVSGFTGEGKSTFTTQLCQEHGKIAKIPWNFNYMTWSRKELMTWIDGKQGTPADPETSLKEGQRPEYSALLADELYAMFYKLNWFEEEQIDAITTLNYCRDRHLLLTGNVPVLWELDPGFRSRLRFYVYIPRGRGIAWVFQPEDNPFTKDPWNTVENMRIFRKNKTPYNCPNFVCEIHFDDWTPEQKNDYYAIRNKKRLVAIDQNKGEKKERYTNIKEQRDNMIRLVFNYNEKITKAIRALNCESCKAAFKAQELNEEFTNKGIGELTNRSVEQIRLTRMGLR